MMPQEQPEPPVNIRLVDEHPSKLLILESSLTALGRHLIKVRSAYEVLQPQRRQDGAVSLLSRTKEKTHFE
jgi:hypothetical protein